MRFLKYFKEIKGDASFRKFYRNKKKNSIIVFAEKERNKNLLIYDAINKIIIRNKILAPKLLNQNYKKNYIEIQDNFADSQGYPSHMVFEFFNPMKTGVRPTIRYYHTCWSGNSWLEEKDMAVVYTSTSVVSGMKLWTNGQNTTCNSLKVYGYK